MATHASSTPAPKIGADQGALRRLIEARIERDLAFLDLMDGDPDLEPAGDDEISLQPEIREGARDAA